MRKGDNINGYEILEDFKVAGGMSKISFAQKGGKDYFIKEFLAPKFPLPDSPGSEKVKLQKRKECELFEKHHQELNKRIASRCSLGGNLVFAVDFFRMGACYYKITEKIDVSSLSCKEISKLPLDKILLVAKTVAHSVKILHDLDIVHGDLKPDNILIKETALGYSGKLIDFDDSYFTGKPPKDRESVVGTPEYYSPEVAEYIMDEEEEIDGNTLTCKSDIFTLGIIFCEYFTGEKPKYDSKFGNIWKCVSQGGSLSFKTMPNQMLLLIKQMLSLEVEKRPTISQVFDILKKKEILSDIKEDTIKITKSTTKVDKLEKSLLRGDLVNKVATVKSESTSIITQLKINI